jgi:hypothetical protein
VSRAASIAARLVLSGGALQQFPGLALQFEAGVLMGLAASQPVEENGFAVLACVADQPQRRRALLLVEFTFAHELDARKQGFVDEEFAAGAGDLAGIEIDRRFLAYRDPVHAGAELGDGPLLARGDDLPELARLDQAGLSDVAEVDAPFLDVLTDVLDGDDGTVIVLPELRQSAEPGQTPIVIRATGFGRGCEDSRTRADDAVPLCDGSFQVQKLCGAGSHENERALQPSNHEIRRPLPMGRPPPTEGQGHIRVMRLRLRAAIDLVT